MMWPFKRKAPPLLPNARLEIVGPVSFGDWSASELDMVSAAIRAHGQKESEGFRRIARVALNTMRGEKAVELVARAIEESMNPGADPDRPVLGSHYMNGMPQWCVWLEYARPAVAAIIAQSRKPSTGC